jgi:hypothetical protein
MQAIDNPRLHEAARIVQSKLKEVIEEATLRGMVLLQINID